MSSRKSAEDKPKQEVKEVAVMVNPQINTPATVTLSSGTELKRGEITIISQKEFDAATERPAGNHGFFLLIEKEGGVN